MIKQFLLKQAIDFVFKCLKESNLSSRDKLRLGDALGQLAWQLEQDLDDGRGLVVDLDSLEV